MQALLTFCAENSNIEYMFEGDRLAAEPPADVIDAAPVQ